MGSANGVGADAEHKQVTVLFADVEGSMDLQEDIGDEEWHGIMNRFLRLLADSVHHFEGTVDKFTGDGVMAVFGAPVAHEDHARRACSAALHLIDAVDAYAEELARTKGLGFHVRVGLNSGEVVVGTIGDDSHMEYTAVGHTVGLAQRMEALAEPGRAYLSEHTARLARGWFALRDLGSFAVKGNRKPVGVYLLEGPCAVHSAYDVSRSRGLSRLVGRAEELAALESALTRAAAGAGQVVGVVGEAGVGKSRLCEEFARSCQERGMRVHRAHGVSHGGRLALLPAVELLRDVFGITDADAPAEARARVTERLVLEQLLDPASEELPILFDFLEVPDPERPPVPMTPDARLRRLFRLLRKVIQRRSDRELVVILLEDLHWFDPASVQFVELLVESYPATRTLVLTNFRPEFQGPWMRHSYYRQLPLTALGAGPVEELLHDLLGADPSLEGLPEHILERTGGNPFFVEEVVRMMFEDGTLEGRRGAYRLTRSADDLRIPPTVQALLAARIDRLAPQEKLVLQTAAVIGRTFSEPVLRRVTDQPEWDLAASLDALRSAEFLHEEALHPVAEYRFWHPLTQEVAYGSLLGERRRRLHAAVARAIAELEPDRADERAALVAQHWEAAGNALEAARWNAREARRSFLRDIPEARRRWEAVIRLLDGAEESDDPLAFDLAVTARIWLVRIAFRLGGDPTAMEALADEARALADRRGDTVGRAVAVYAKGFLLFGLGRLDPALALLGEAERSFGEIGDTELLATGTITGYVLSARGPLALGLSYIDQTMELAVGDPEAGMRRLGISLPYYGLFHRAWLLARMGRLDAAARAAEEAAALGRVRNVLELSAWSHAVHPLIAYLRHDPSGALDHARLAVQRADELGSPIHAVMALEGMGAGSLAAGRVDDAVGALEQALVLSRDRHVARFEEASVLSFLAEACLLAGEGPKAIEVADEAVEVARAQHARVHECQALATRARVRRTVLGRDAGDGFLADVGAARAAIEETGAAVWSPVLDEEAAHWARLMGEG
jgi:class 3 adenylate cyclase/tetratricopeptide (TPR) repeat protein